MHKVYLMSFELVNRTTGQVDAIVSRTGLQMREGITKDEFLGIGRAINNKLQSDTHFPRLLEDSTAKQELIPIKVPPQTKQNYIYFIGTPEVVKIGISQNIKSRLASLQTASPVKLSLYCSFVGDGGTERNLHRKFGRYRLHGEWFTLSEEIKKYIKEHSNG